MYSSERNVLWNSWQIIIDLFLIKYNFWRHGSENTLLVPYWKIIITLFNMEM